MQLHCFISRFVVKHETNPSSKLCIYDAIAKKASHQIYIQSADENVSSLFVESLQQLEVIM